MFELNEQQIKSQDIKSKDTYSRIDILLSITEHRYYRWNLEAEKAPGVNDYRRNCEGLLIYHVQKN